MIFERIDKRIEDLISQALPLAEVAAALRRYRDQGLTRAEAKDTLDLLRTIAVDEVAEDRVLEVLDVVSGFCPPSLTVWD